MKPKQFLFFILTALLNLLPAYGQVYTYETDLSDRAHLPIYDCTIYSKSRNANLCRDLQKQQRPTFENYGYAVDCRTFSKKQNECLRLAQEISQNAPTLINCSNINNRINYRRCEVTKEAYTFGRFENFSENYAVDPLVYNSTVLTRNSEITTQTTCDMNAFDLAQANYALDKQEQQRRGRNRAILGAVVTVGGIILGASNDETTRNVGQGMQIGGRILTLWGLVEMADAHSYYPHLNPFCQTEWINERRMVVVESQQCVTTRYSQRNYYSSHYYYEVNCSSRRYVTFEEFSPWDSGRPY